MSVTNIAYKFTQLLQRGKITSIAPGSIGNINNMPYSAMLKSSVLVSNIVSNNSKVLVMNVPSECWFEVFDAKRINSILNCNNCATDHKFIINNDINQ